MAGAHPSEHRGVDPGKLIERTQYKKTSKQKRIHITAKTTHTKPHNNNLKTQSQTRMDFNPIQPKIKLGWADNNLHVFFPHFFFKHTLKNNQFGPNFIEQLSTQICLA